MATTQKILMVRLIVAAYMHNNEKTTNAAGVIEKMVVTSHQKAPFETMLQEVKSNEDIGCCCSACKQSWAHGN